MTVLHIDLPASPGELLLWAHTCLLWVVVNYMHRLDPIDRAKAREGEGDGPRRWWRAGVVTRAALVGAVAAGMTSLRGTGVALGLVFFVAAAGLPLARTRWMRTDAVGWGHDLRAEWELGVNALALAGSAALIGAGGLELEVALVTLPFSHGELSTALLAAAGALFLVRGGTHVVRGVLEKTETLPAGHGSGREDELRHGVTIGNIERLLIYLFALAGSHAAIGLVVAAKGVVRAVEWRDRALVEYFLIGTLASAGLASAVGIGLRWFLGPF